MCGGLLGCTKDQTVNVLRSHFVVDFAAMGSCLRRSGPPEDVGLGTSTDLRVKNTPAPFATF